MRSLKQEIAHTTRFLSSNLYLNYTPPASSGVGFNTGGAFGSTGFRLASFTTTAIPAAGLPDALRWAYQDSEIAADTIGTVTLSGLNTDNAGVAFGIKVGSPGAIVVVKMADVTNDPDLPFNTNLTADKAAPYDALAGNFFDIQV